MEREFSGITIQCRPGTIVNQEDCEAIVNAANAQLETGGGVAGAIHRAAGPGLVKEARPMAPIRPGEAVITGGHNLPNKYIIHCLGPVYGRDKPEDQLLARCYENALKLAEEKGIRTIAFPAISTGVFGYPLEEAAKIAISAILEQASALKHVKKIRFVLHSTEDLKVHERVLIEILKSKRK